MAAHDPLNEYLQTLRDGVEGSDPNLAKVIKTLVEETIRFRDQLRAESGCVLTVGETRQALDGFQKVWAGKPMPENLSRTCRALVAIWLYSLKETSD